MDKKKKQILIDHRTRSLNQRKLPNGEYTNDVNIYLDAWHEIGDALVKILGPDYSLHSFDPDICVVNKKDMAGRVEVLRVGTAKRIARLAKFV